MPSHPDAHGHHLRRVARALDAWLKARDKKKTYSRIGVFWDFMSLHQHPPGGSRTPVEDRLFKRALDGLGDIYSHAATTTFMLTTFPADYPAGYELPDGANVNEYFERGSRFLQILPYCFCARVRTSQEHGYSQDHQASLRGCLCPGGRANG